MFIDIEYMFKEDIFSKPGPSYAIASDSDTKSIKNVITTHYFNIGHDFTVYVLKGNELNSRNFLIATSNVKYLVKKVAKNFINTANKLSKLHKLLSSMLKIIPLIVPNKSNELFTSRNDGFDWILMQFIDGIYYDGRGTEPLKSIAISYCQLKECLKKLSLTEIGGGGGDISQLCYIIGDEIELWKFAMTHKNDLLKYAPEETVKCFIENYSYISNEISSTEFYAFKNLDPTLNYIDWHPYNILIKNDEVNGILDLDSIHLSCSRVSVSFGAYKMLRQYMVHHKRELISTHTSVVELYLEHCMGDTLIGKIEIERYVKIELLRRIFIILRLVFKEHDNSWAHVLPMHIAGLKEVSYIFKN